MRYSDLNVEDRADFKQLKNLEDARIAKAFRKSVVFLKKQTTVRAFQDQLQLE